MTKQMFGTKITKICKNMLELDERCSRRETLCIYVEKLLYVYETKIKNIIIKTESLKIAYNSSSCEVRVFLNSNFGLSLNKCSTVKTIRI